LRISCYLSDDQLAAMSDAEIEAWSEAQAIGPWTPNDVALAPARPMASVTVRLPREVLADLETEAALHRQACQPYVRDLLLLALRLVQDGRLARR
jgi:hypothetical protein